MAKPAARVLAAALGLPSAWAARRLLAVLARHRLVAVAGPQRYSLQPLVRQQAALLGAGLGEGLQAAAEGRFVGLTLRRLGEWADMYHTPREWRLALAAARERQADVGRLVELLAPPPSAGDSQPAAASGQLPAVAVAAALTDRVLQLLGTLGVGLVGRLRPACEGLLARLKGPQPGGATQEEVDLAAAAVLYALGCIEHDKGCSSKAYNHVERSYKLRRRLLGEELSDTAASLAAGAACCADRTQKKDMLKQALELRVTLPLGSNCFRKEALSIRRRVLGEEHPDTSRSVYNLAALHHEAQHAFYAEPLYKEALDLQHRSCGEGPLDKAATLLSEAAHAMYSRHYTEAEPFYQQALELLQRELGEEHLGTANTLINLAVCVNAQKRREEATQLYVQALELRRRALGEQHADPVPCLSALKYHRGSCGYLGMWPLPLFREGVALQPRLLGGEPLDKGTTLISLAACIHDRQCPGEPEGLFRLALELQRRTLGAEHPDTAIPLIALAACLHAEGRCAEAAPLYRQALELRRPTLDLAEQAEEEEDWGIAVPLSVSLAASLHAQGRYSEAEPMYRQALEMLGRYGEALDNAIVLSGLAACLQAQGRCAEAEPLYRQALELFERIPAKRYMQEWVDDTWFVDRPDKGTVLRSLAACAHAQGRYAEAEPLYRQALERVLELEQEQELNDDEVKEEKFHELDKVAALLGLAACLNAQGRLAEAEPLYEEALALQQRLYRKSHRDIAMTQTRLAACQESQAGIDTEALLRQALELQRSELGEEHPDTADARTALAACLWARGRYCEAEPLYRQALELSRGELGEGHPDTAQSLFDLAVCTEHQGRYSEATVLHRKALELRRRVLGEDHADTNTSRKCLADLHNIWVWWGWDERAKPLVCNVHQLGAHRLRCYL